MDSPVLDMLAKREGAENAEIFGQADARTAEVALQSRTWLSGWEDASNCLAKMATKREQEGFEIAVDLRRLTFDVRGGHKRAKPACGCPLDGGVSRRRLHRCVCFGHGHARLGMRMIATSKPDWEKQA
jgi:hypothetical protein